jgi:hypothetical protein
MPHRLAQILPKVDVEGGALTHQPAIAAAQNNPAARESARI